MKAKTIFISRDFYGLGNDILKKSGHVIKINTQNRSLNQNELIESCQNADGLISFLHDKIDTHFFDQCPKLKVIAQYAVGFNNIDLLTATKNKILVTNTPDVLTEATSEIALSHLLNLSRNIPKAMADIKNGLWKSWGPKDYLGPGLKGKTLGIIGMGRIGKRVSQMCHYGHDMNIICTPFKSSKNEIKFPYEEYEFFEVLKKSDFISVHCPLTEDTKNLFNMASFKMMKPTAYFINTARGEIHNEEDLHLAIKENIIAGAGLDVTNPEPMPKDSPLLKFPQVLVTPHIGSATLYAREKMGILCATNIIMGLNGERPNQLVNTELYE